MRELIHGMKMVCAGLLLGLLFPVYCHSQIICIDTDSDKKLITDKISPNSFHGFNSHFFSSPENIDDSFFWKLFEELHMPLLRFPGGLADWYNWTNGAIETTNRVTLSYMKGNEFRKIPIEDIIKIIKKYKIKLVYVLNVYDSEEKINGLIKRLLSSGVEICGIEIGNELYTKSLSDEFGGPVEYLKKSRVIVKILRKAGYIGPIGVNLASPWWNPGQENHVHRKSWWEWNTTLCEDGLADFDAVIQHFYPVVKKIGFQAAVNDAPGKFKNIVKDIRDQFPGKQVWITEWNLSQPVSIPEFNSLYHAIFNMRMFAAFMETGVDLTCYHVINGRGWELIGPDRFSLDYYNSQNVKMIRRVPYFAFKIFGEAYKNATEYKIGKIKDVEYMILSSGKRLSIICWTTNNCNYKLVLENLKKNGFISGLGLQGDNLSSSNGNLTRWRKEKKDLPWKENCTLKFLDSLEFKGPGIFRFDILNKFNK